MDPQPRRPTAGEKYAFVITNAWTVRVMYAIGILAWIGVLAGYVVFLNLNVWYWVAFGPLLAVFTAYHFLTYAINLFYRPFDVKAHRRKVAAFWRKTDRVPTVDILVPVCGEDEHILMETFAAVRDVSYEPAAKRVVVLDDRGDDNVKRLAAKMGFAYLSRPDKGVMKKAGNLQYGLDRTDGEFVAVFDADFAPHEDFLIELVPYMADEKVGIVQSPQHFRTDRDVHRRSGLEYGAGQSQEDFYRIIQVARDRFGGAICVGSNAVYRRDAVERIGGMPQIDHSEDVHLGFDMISAGYAIRYVPLVLATGVCPSEIHSYFHQQHRWCSGSMSLWLSEKFRKARLTPMQRLCYWSGILYYVTHALSLVMAFQIFVVLFLHHDAISWTYALPFIPHLIYTFIALPLFRTSRPRLGTMLVRAAHAYSYTHSVVANAVRGPLNWHPTNTRHADVSRAFLGLIAFNAAYVLLYAMFAAYALATGRLPLTDIDYYPVVFWVWYFFVTNGVFLWHTFRAVSEARMRASGARSGRRWATAVGGTYAMLIVALFGSALAVARTPASPTASPTIVAADPPEPTHPSDRSRSGAEPAPATVVSAQDPSRDRTAGYAAVAAPGDSVTRLYRRVIADYCADGVDRELDAPQRTFMETVLAATDGRSTIAVGDEVVADTAGLDDLRRAAAALDEDARAAWSRYAASITFERACDGTEIAVGRDVPAIARR